MKILYVGISLIGEFKAKIRSDYDNQLARNYAVGEQNENGEILIDMRFRQCE